MIKRLRKRLNKRGFTLLEMVVAILLTAIIITTVSGVIGYSLSVQKQALINSALYTVSQRIHAAFNTQLAAARTMYAYMNATTAHSSLGAGDWVLYRGVAKNSNGTPLLDGDGNNVYHLFLDESGDSGKEFLFGADSYNGCSVTAFYVTVDTVLEYRNAEDAEIVAGELAAGKTPSLAKGQYVRIITLHTTVTYMGETYDHFSTIRLYNLLYTGSEVMEKGATVNGLDRKAQIGTNYQCLVFSGGSR